VGSSELNLSLPGSTVYMAPKAHRSAPGITRHSRSTSGGSSKVGLNLNFTQKEPVTLQTTTVRKPKVNGAHRHEAGSLSFPIPTSDFLRTLFY
jgi:hypothetical protein